jgi:hypothetical protein
MSCQACASHPVAGGGFTAKPAACVTVAPKSGACCTCMSRGQARGPRGRSCRPRLAAFGCGTSMSARRDATGRPAPRRPGTGPTVVAPTWTAPRSAVAEGASRCFTGPPATAVRCNTCNIWGWSDNSAGRRHFADPEPAGRASRRLARQRHQPVPSVRAACSFAAPASAAPPGADIRRGTRRLRVARPHAPPPPPGSGAGVGTFPGGRRIALDRTAPRPERLERARLGPGRAARMSRRPIRYM